MLLANTRRTHLIQNFSVTAVQPRAHRPQLAIYLARGRAHDERTNGVPARKTVCDKFLQAFALNAQQKSGHQAAVSTRSGHHTNLLNAGAKILHTNSKATSV